MRRLWRASAALAIAGGLLAGCATPQGPVATSGPPAPPWSNAAPPQAAPPPPRPYRLELAALAGWGEEDYRAALAAVIEACAVNRDPGWAGVCQRAEALDPPDQEGARRFLEANFRAEPVAGTGLLTGYFSPIYQASRFAQGAFTAPVRGPPLPTAGPTAPADVASPASPPGDRAAIEAEPAIDALAWMRPEDLFVLQIQGSGVLEFADGARERAVFAGSNGAPFRGVAEAMRQQGLLADAASSADAIHDWLAANRGPAADAIMDLDPRYVYFRLAPEIGAGARGAAGMALPPGRGLAVDPVSHGMGELLWIDAAAPGLEGARPSYRRLTVALDTGGAIKGPVRADLYLGEGLQAGEEAGRVRHALRLYRLTPAP